MGRFPFPSPCVCCIIPAMGTTGNDIKELERRLGSLPDVYPGFAEPTLDSLIEHGLAMEVLEMLREDASATTETVLLYEMQRRGVIEIEA